MNTSYDPAAKFELKVSEVDFRRTPGGRQLMARIYQPQGTGRFLPCSTCTAERGAARIDWPKNRWIARSRPAE